MQTGVSLASSILTALFSNPEIHKMWERLKFGPPWIRISLYQNTQMFGFSQNQM
jgi:hypothetical protein